MADLWVSLRVDDVRELVADVQAAGCPVPRRLVVAYCRALAVEHLFGGGPPLKAARVAKDCGVTRKVVRTIIRTEEFVDPTWADRWASEGRPKGRGHLGATSGPPRGQSDHGATDETEDAGPPRGHLGATSGPHARVHRHEDKGHETPPPQPPKGGAGLSGSALERWEAARAAFVALRGEGDRWQPERGTGARLAKVTASPDEHRRLMLRLRWAAECPEDGPAAWAPLRAKAAREGKTNAATLIGGARSRNAAELDEAAEAWEAAGCPSATPDTPAPATREDAAGVWFDAYANRLAEWARAGSPRMSREPGDGGWMLHPDHAQHMRLRAAIIAAGATYTRIGALEARERPFRLRDMRAAFVAAVLASPAPREGVGGAPGGSEVPPTGANAESGHQGRETTTIDPALRLVV